MKTCEDHDDCIVVYTDDKYHRSYCPMCNLVTVNDNRVAEMEASIDSLMSTISALEDQIAESNDAGP